MRIGNRPNSLIVLMAVVVILAFSEIAISQPASATRGSMGTLVSTEWLSEHLNDSDLIVLDCTVYMEMDSSGGMRAVCGRTRYEAGHIGSAGFADLMGDLCDIDSPLGFAIPTPEQFCKAMGKLGVGDDSRVVLYDAYNSVWAARVWWMLRWVGFDRAALLDGGLTAWTAEGRQLSTEPSDHPIRKLSPSIRPELIADRDEVFAAMENEAVHLIDAMPEMHFQGKMAMYGRPGHIPGAINIPATALIDETGCYRSDDTLSAMIAGTPEERYITYCGGGIAASSNAFIMIRLGYRDVAVYMASLQEWSADPANPLATDER